MTLIVGLGNPTPKYNLTRHNVGFMLIDSLLDFGEFINVSTAKFQGELYKKDSIILLKPTTFMNLSGNSVKLVKDFYKPDRIIVVHDDLDLPFGAVKFKNGGSSGGHNGLKSIDGLIGTNYDRIRIGIGKSGNAANWVLERFSSNELKHLKQVFDYVKRSIDELLYSDILSIAQKYNTKQAFIPQSNESPLDKSKTKTGMD